MATYLFSSGGNKMRPPETQDGDVYQNLKCRPPSQYPIKSNKDIQK